MATFFLVDQSLCNVGGHHYDYLRLVSGAADAVGMTTVIGSHCRLPAAGAIEQFGEIHRIFRDETYCRHSLLAGMEELTRGGHRFFESYETNQSSPLKRFLRRRRYRRLIQCRSERIRRFAQDCDQFFSPHTFEDGDHAFFCTMSELDFMGLCAFLSNHPRTLQVNWHVQFHFAMLAGRPPEYDRQQTRLRSICECFQTAIDRIPYHQLRLYTTTDELAEQYNRMEVATFEALPYPIDPRLFQPVERPEIPPLTMTCAGAVRREKGQKQHVLNLIDGLEQHVGDTAPVSIQVQCGDSRWLKRGRNSESSGVRVQAVKHPLSEADYFDLIRHSDVGLFFYDARRYYSRRAGILSEFLANGKPVVVPAGSWLSNQIAGASFNYIDSVVSSTRRQREFPLLDTTWDPANAPASGGIIGFDQQRVPFSCRFKARPGETQIVVQFDWHWPLDSGAYCQTEFSFFGPSGQILQTRKFVVGHRDQGQSPNVMANLPAGTEEVEVRFSNACIDASISLKNVIFRVLSRESCEPVPTGAVGVIVPAPDQLLDSVAEMVHHYDHYRYTAAAFADSWSRRHDPMQTMRSLLGDPITTSRAA